MGESVNGKPAVSKTVTGGSSPSSPARTHRGLMKSFLLALVLFALVGCSNQLMSPDHARDFLQKQGFTHINVGESASWECGNNGPGGVKFNALNSNHIYVSGAVCEGFNSGIVIVYDN